MILAKPQIHLACWVFSFFEKNLFDASINQVKVESTNVSKKSFLISSFSPYILGTKAFLKNPKKTQPSFFSHLHDDVLVFEIFWVVRSNTQTKVVQVCFSHLSKIPPIHDIIRKATFAYRNFNLSHIRYWGGISYRKLIKWLNSENKKT